MSAAYLDASAVVKLFKPESESERLAGALASHELWISSEVVAIEAACTARRAGDQAMVELAESVVARLELVLFTAAVRARAAAPFRRALRALDAVHAATALSVANEFDVTFVYDADLADALEAEGVKVLAPGSA